MSDVLKLCRFSKKSFRALVKPCSRSLIAKKATKISNRKNLIFDLLGERCFVPIYILPLFCINNLRELVDNFDHKEYTCAETTLILTVVTAKHILP